LVNHVGEEGGCIFVEVLFEGWIDF